MENLYIMALAVWVLGFGLYTMYTAESKPTEKGIILCIGTVILFFIGVFFFPQLFESF